MPEVDSIKQVLAQAQAMERVQEAARRQDQKRRHFAHDLERQADDREEKPGAEEKVPNHAPDPDGERKTGPARPGAEDGEEAPVDPEGSGAEEEDRGQHLDVRA